MNEEKEKKEEFKLQDIDCPEIYSNHMKVESTFGEFSLTFAQTSPKRPLEPKPQIRIIAAPYFITQMIEALKRQLDRYEKRWGPVKYPPKPTEEK